VAWESGGGAWHRPASRPQKPDRHAKTIVFCEDINHTARIRQALANANADICATQPKYVVQITGDNPEGPRKRDNFMGRDPAAARKTVQPQSRNQRPAP